MYSILPDARLIDGDISNAFKELSLTTYHEACEYVWHLPYGRTSDSKSWMLVLKEKTGTCSSKHALLKALADELNLNIELVVGIYAMTECNTQGVGKVLSNTKYDYIPEAHCYLRFNGIRIDLTRYSMTSKQPIEQFFVEKIISYDDIGDIKTKFHKKFIDEMVGVQEA
ncbi:MAG: hypothetical protein V5788_05390 [Shewanella sp.]